MTAPGDDRSTTDSTGSILGVPRSRGSDDSQDSVSLLLMSEKVPYICVSDTAPGMTEIVRSRGQGAARGWELGKG